MTTGERTLDLSSEFDLRAQERKYAEEGLFLGLQGAIEELNSTNKGRVALSESGFHEYIILSSNRLNDVRRLIEDGTLTHDNITPKQASIIYHLTPSIVDMRYTPEILELIAAGTVKDILQLEESGEEPRRILRTRRLASIVEELGFISIGTAAEEYESQAIELNEEVLRTSLPELAVSPRKTHAPFSILDINFRGLNRHAPDDLGESKYSEIHRGLTIKHFETLIRPIDLAISLDETQAHSISGAIGEGLVLGKLHRFLTDNQLWTLNASQSTIRHNNSNNTGLRVLPKKKRAFDIMVANQDMDKLARIEVKKLTLQNGQDNGYSRLPLTSAVEGLGEEYLPIIDVVVFKLGTNNSEYFKIAKKYCSAQIKELSGEAINAQEKAVLDNFDSQVEPQLVKILQKRKLLKAA